MSLIEIIQNRYSCRSYLEKEIEQEKLEKILEAARLAPSAKNLQDWRFVVVKDKEMKTEVAAFTNRPSVFEIRSVPSGQCPGGRRQSGFRPPLLPFFLHR